MTEFCDDMMIYILYAILVSFQSFNVFSLIQVKIRTIYCSSFFSLIKIKHYDALEFTEYSLWL